MLVCKEPVEEEIPLLIELGDAGQIQNIYSIHYTTESSGNT